MKKELTKNQKRLDADLWIIAIVTMLVFSIYAVTGNKLMAFCKDSSVSVWPRLFAAAAVEYGIAGLGITIVCLLRKESFVSFGLKKENLLKAIAGTILCFVPYILFVFLTGQFNGYSPLTVMVSDDLAKAGIVTFILGTLIIALVWGFFEGFNYAVICEIIDRRYPLANKYLSWGAMVCAFMCILFHPFSTSLLGIIEIITTFIAIYGMLIVRKITGNSWGCVFAFLFIWNAL
jgi:hypothetical protein